MRSDEIIVAIPGGDRSLGRLSSQAVSPPSTYSGMPVT